MIFTQIGALPGKKIFQAIWYRRGILTLACAGKITGCEP
jgi:hypothetical protein